MASPSQIIDISPLLSPRLAVWPGDVALSRSVALDVAKGDSVTLSSLHSTAHLGAHADAERHFLAGGATIEKADLGVYLGKCRVVHANVPEGGVVSCSDLDGLIDSERILLKTGTFPDPSCFNTDFASIDPELALELGKRGVRLLGLDVPSVDRFDSKELPAHKALASSGIAILEGLVLAHVEPGCYELIALPLKLAGFDASPVRAVLRTIE